MSDITGVMTVIFLFQLLTRENGLCAVHDDHVIAAIHMRSKGRLLLAAKQNGSLRGDAAQRLAGGVNHIPLAVDLAAFGHISRHGCYLLNSRSFL